MLYSDVYEFFLSDAATQFSLLSCGKRESRRQLPTAKSGRDKHCLIFACSLYPHNFISKNLAAIPTEIFLPLAMSSRRGKGEKRQSLQK